MGEEIKEKKKEDKKFSLANIKNALGESSKDFLKGLQKEIVEEEQNSLKDFIKGAYRFSLEKEREVEKIQKEVSEIKAAIDQASKGSWELLGNIKIPARFFEESTLRKHGKSLVSGNQEIRFLDLYVPQEEE